MSDYTPTTDYVRTMYGQGLRNRDVEAQFDRWLADHDARIASEAAERAWDEGWGDCWNFHQSEGMKGREDNPYAAEREDAGKGES